MAAARFMRKGITRFYFVTTVAAAATPTASELNAGLRLDTQMSSVNGFSFTNNPIQTPDMSTKFVSQIGGEDTTEDSSMEMYRIRGATDTIFAGLVKDTVGYMAIADRGIAGSTWAIADVVDFWTVQITSKAKMYSADNEAAKYRVTFALLAPPLEDYAVAA